MPVCATNTPLAVRCLTNDDTETVDMNYAIVDRHEHTTEEWKQLDGQQTFESCMAQNNYKSECNRLREIVRPMSLRDVAKHASNSSRLILNVTTTFTRNSPTSSLLSATDSL